MEGQRWRIVKSLCTLYIEGAGVWLDFLTTSVRKSRFFSLPMLNMMPMFFSPCVFGMRYPSMPHPCCELLLSRSAVSPERLFPPVQDCRAATYSLD